jgi:hypothetical protein
MSGLGWQRASENLARKVARAEGGGYVPIRATYFELHTVSGGNSGTVAVPTGFTIALDAWPDGVDALVVTVDGNNLPTYQQATTALGVPITTTLDLAGDYTLSATPGDATVAVIYMARGFFKFFDESKSVEQFIFELPEFYPFIAFDTAPVGVPAAPGTLSWNAVDNTLDLIINAVTLQIGQETYIRVKNDTASQLDNGSGAGFAGVVGATGRITAKPYLADGSEPNTFFAGVFTEDIAVGEEGFISTFGNVRGFDTSVWPVGTILYASETVAGGYQTTPSIVEAAVVVKQDALEGQILVRPTFLPGTAGILLTGETGVSQGGIDGTYTKVVNWQGSASRGAIADTVLSRITASVAGQYTVALEFGFSGSPSTSFIFSIFKNGAQLSIDGQELVAPRTIGAGGDSGKTTIETSISLAADEYVEVFVKCDGAAKSITQLGAQFTLSK